MVKAINVPICEDAPPTQFPIHIDIKLTSEQATILRRIAMQLDRTQAILKNGRRAVSASDAVKFLIELVGA